MLVKSWCAWFYRAVSDRLGANSASYPQQNTTNKKIGASMTSGNRLSIALIGCGAVTQILYTSPLANLQRAGLIETAALVDPNPESTAYVGRMLSAGRQYQDINAMLAECSVDLAIVAAPHRYHADLSVTCLQRGIPVLCEKPMALTSADCDRMVKAADEAGCLLAVGHFRRFFPATKMVKGILKSGLLGEIRSFRFLEGEIYNWPVKTASPFKRAEAGGGVLIDIGAHTVDLLLWWLGEVSEVQYEDDSMGGVEVNCRVHLRMVNGAEGIVQLSRDCPLPNRYLIECDKGWIAYRCDVVDRIEWGLYDSDYGLDAEIRVMSNPAWSAKSELGLPVPRYMDCFETQLRNVIAAVQGVETLSVPGTEGRKCIDLIETCYNNRTLLAMPWLDETEMQRARELSNA
jgi:predicted dehydrogenase